jgi:hypothetical protein
MRPRTAATDDSWAKDTQRRVAHRFHQPGEWWMSAETALEMLSRERQGLLKSQAEEPGRIQKGLLAANRFIVTRIKEMMKGSEKQEVCLCLFCRCRLFCLGVFYLGFVLVDWLMKSSCVYVCVYVCSGAMICVRMYLTTYLSM